MWLKLVLALIQSAAALVGFLRERRLLKAGEDAVIADAFKKQSEAVAAGLKAREEKRADNARIPDGGKLSNDGFRRD